jgi:V/A-type H+-transporting ATPase subunit D
MTPRAVRSQLHERRRELQAARLGRGLLDDKREAILRALLERNPRHAETRRAAAEALAQAQGSLLAARLDNGGRAVDAATLAQPPSAGVDWRPGSVVGVPTPRLEGEVPPFTPRYGTAALTAKLDRAGEDYSALAGALIAFAEQAEAVRNLQSGLSRTVRRLRALEQIVIPDIERALRAVAATLEEEERDDAVRYRQADALRKTTWPHEPNGIR